MINLLTFLMIFMMISLLFMFMNFMFSKKSLMSREKSSPFECGFDPMNNNRIPFSIQFFLMSLVFLIFDIEIALLLPFISHLFLPNKIMLTSSFLFIILLLWGLYIEYLEKSLDWKN